MQLADLFAQAKSNRIVWEGSVVFGMLAFEPERTFTVRFGKRTANPQQGVRFASDAKMSVAGQTSKLFFIWADSAPPTFPVELLGPDSQKVKMSNIWRFDGGVAHTWVGNYGMHIRRTTSGVEAWCNDGTSKRPTFTDLFVQIDGVKSTEPLGPGD